MLWARYHQLAGSPYQMQLHLAAARRAAEASGFRALAVEVDGHTKLTHRLLAIPGVELVQDGDFEKTFHFPLAAFDPVAEIVRPHHRRQFTDEQRAEQAQRLARNLAIAEKPPSRSGASEGESLSGGGRAAPEAQPRQEASR